jgi:RHS repeat-associated protein
MSEGRTVAKSDRYADLGFSYDDRFHCTNYLYDGRDLLEEVDNSGNVLARYADGPGFDQPLSMLRSSTTSYYQSDVLSTITSLSNGAGALANTYTYDSYGKLTASTGSITNPLQYTGREFDPESGIYYYRARYYDPSAGRFISEDPIRFQGGIDFYAYTLNNPVNWIDPFGLEAQECRRPLNLPFSGNLPPHTFVYSTQSGTGYGLGPKNNGWAAWGAESGKPVPGNIEKDYPYDPSGKLKPNYQCSKVTDDKCFEDCVNQKPLDATRSPPSYQFGAYQCDTWANDIERQCRQQCKKK